MLLVYMDIIKQALEGQCFHITSHVLHHIFHISVHTKWILGAGSQPRIAGPDNSPADP